MNTRAHAKEWSRSVKSASELTLGGLLSFRSAAAEWLSGLRLARPKAWSLITDQLWRLGIGFVSVLVPAMVLALVMPRESLTTPGVVLIVAVAFSTYLADLVGGLTALCLSAILLDLFFVGQATDFGAPQNGTELAAFVITLVCGALVIWLIQHIKLESMVDRRAAVAARAAANALASVEAAAASHARGNLTSRIALNRSLLRAMVSINRAHFGVLFLVDDETAELRVGSSYGLDSIAPKLSTPADIGESFIEQVVMQRRSRAITDLAGPSKQIDSLLHQVNARAILGVPLIDPDDQLFGVVVVGLLVPHRFTQTEIARLEALATRASAVLQAAVGIDARENALHSATESKRWLELVIAAMPEAVVLAMPPDGRIVAENQAAVALLGHLTDLYPSNDILERLSMPDGDPLDPGQWPIRQALDSGNVVTGVEMLARGILDVQVPVLVSAAPVIESNGDVVAVVAVFRDIASLKEAARLKDEFVSVVSHELRSPLTPIRGFVQLVARDLAREGGHEPQVSRLNSIAGHVDRMTRLVDDLLDVSRLKSGSLEIRRGPIKLSDLCRDVIRDRTTATNHNFVLEAGDHDLRGDWDADRLYQVIDNLVGNAIKYSPPGGTVTISTGFDQERGEAIVTVADDGPGISPADRDRVFSAFYRTPDAAASQVAGLGLGLYICHELVLAHDGSIEVGDAPAGGAAFTVRLPLMTRAVAA